MLALALCLAIFFFWTIVGWSFVTLLNPRDEPVRNALLAPVAGAALTMLPLLWLNRFGLPVRNIGPPIAVGYLLLAAFIIYWTRPAVPWRQLKTFAAILGIALLITGYPMLLYGFDWVSYCNDDMANYVLSAHLFLNHGFFDLPDTKLLLENRDASLNIWFLYALAGVRPGSELILSWVLSCTGLTGHQIYMPVMMAMHLVLISATAALVYRSAEYRLPATVASAWLAVSALNTLGTIYQLIAQVFGLSLLAGTSALLLRAFEQTGVWQMIRWSILVGLFGAATGAAYPEITPFVVLSFGLFHALALIRREEKLGTLMAALGPILLFTLLFLNTFIPSTISFLSVQAGRSLVPVDLGHTLFPYYLVPSGFANFWGMLPLAQQLSEPFLSAIIIVGAMLLALTAAAALWQAWRGQPVAFICVIMLVLGVQLAHNRNDFGLFKLAMYIQPFLLGSTVLAWLQTAQRRFRVEA